jgi:hypothetical protein
VSDETKLRHALFAHIEQKSDEVWKSIDDLQKAMEAVPHADQSGPEWGGDGELSKRFIELMKRLGDIGHQFRLGYHWTAQSRFFGLPVATRWIISPTRFPKPALSTARCCRSAIGFGKWFAICSGGGRPEFV